MFSVDTIIVYSFSNALPQSGKFSHKFNNRHVMSLHWKLPGTAAQGV
jgi:hypothetical protein